MLNHYRLQGSKEYISPDEYEEVINNLGEKILEGEKEALENLVN